MRTQQDTKVRMVALANLTAMCERISGTCHRYWIEKVTPNRVHVGYSNPNEYGSEFPMYAVFPCYKSDIQGDEDNPRVILEYLGVIRDSHDGEGWQCFEELRDCRPLFRTSSDSDDWKTEYEILSTRVHGFAVSHTWDKDGCIQTYHCHGSDFRGWQEAQDWAVIEMRKIEDAERDAKLGITKP